MKVIVPFGAGGPADVTARQIGNILQESFGQPFVIENRTGAGGVIGTQEAVKSPPDGYTLLMMSNTQTANEALVPQRKYELMRDLVPIAPVNYSDLVIVVHPSVQAKTLQEFIALAKSQPGKLNYASSGQGTPYHMAGELFKAMAGIDVLHVPYRNSGEARSGVIGGQVQMMIDAVPAMAPNVAENQVRALATTGKTRSTVLPNAPTVIEAGVPGYEATIWLGLMAPAGTPKPIIDNPQLGHFGYDPRRLRIHARDPPAGSRILDVALPVPHKSPDIEFIVYDPAAALCVPIDERALVRPVMRPA